MALYCNELSTAFGLGDQHVYNVVTGRRSWTALRPQAIHSPERRLPNRPVKLVST